MISAPTAVARPALRAAPMSSALVMRLLRTPTQAGRSPRVLTFTPVAAMAGKK